MKPMYLSKTYIFRGLSKVPDLESATLSFGAFGIPIKNMPLRGKKYEEYIAKCDQNNIMPFSLIEYETNSNTGDINIRKIEIDGLAGLVQPHLRKKLFSRTGAKFIEGLPVKAHHVDVVFNGDFNGDTNQDFLGYLLKEDYELLEGRMYYPAFAPGKSIIMTVSQKAGDIYTARFEGYFSSSTLEEAEEIKKELQPRLEEVKRLWKPIANGRK